ncbi:MAG: DUF4143 domain-containing protein [Gammaproteobacteria bacterium]|nr:DUF4143 domain-containing protein [Gammaproteobacteria bacterium]
MTYQSRIADIELEQRLSSAGGVVIEGPKACGKTATARQRAASEVLLDVDEEARRTIAIDAALVLDGKTPRLIDEWQVEPNIWNHIRRAVDDRARPGQFILTGSAVPADDITRHTGAGRLARLRMRPMSLFEAGRSSGVLSLADLLAGAPPRSPRAELSVSTVAELVSVGGWPGHLGRSPKYAQQANRHYLAEVCRSDIERVDGIRRDPEKVSRFLQSLARNVATQAAVSTMAKDVGGADGALRENTAHEYLTALERLMIVEDQPAWTPHLRSRSKLRGRPKRHFVDPSLAVAALRANPDRLLKDLNLLGLLFESMVIRDLRIYAQAAEAEVLQYRDNTGLEVDAIIQAGDGRWAAFEVKLGAARVDEGAASLLKFVERVDLDRCGKPSALGVIVSDGYGYVREDGISVIPIGALGP